MSISEKVRIALSLQMKQKEVQRHKDAIAEGRETPDNAQFFLDTLENEIRDLHEQGDVVNERWDSKGQWD